MAEIWNGCGDCGHYDFVDRCCCHTNHMGEPHGEDYPACGDFEMVEVRKVSE